MKTLIIENNNMGPFAHPSIMLQRGIFETTVAKNARDGVAFATAFPWEVIVISQQGLDMEVIEIVTYLRSEVKIKTPIVVIGTPCVKTEIACLAAGASSYYSQTTAISSELLKARLHSVVNLYYGSFDSVVTVDNLVVNYDTDEVIVAEKFFPLPRRERRILQVLARRVGMFHKRSDIFGKVYDAEDLTNSATVESHISKLRKKLAMSLFPGRIDNQRFTGYRLVSGSH